MGLRAVIAVSDEETLALIRELLQAALALVRHDVQIAHTDTRQALLARTLADQDDVIFLDWELVGPETPDLVREIARLNPRLRTVVLLPLHLRQYRQCLWEAGAYSSIPKEYLDQEWLSSVLCLIRRAIDRETAVARLAKAPTAAARIEALLT
ncbi:MAG: response regulator [Anaerolineae bacterium]